jgi:hypothetical protein
MNLSNNLTRYYTFINSSTVFNNVKKSSINNPREWDFWDYSFMACLIFGMIGNSLSIIVMSAKKLRNTNAALFVCTMSQIILNKNFTRRILII